MPPRACRRRLPCVAIAALLVSSAWAIGAPPVEFSFIAGDDVQPDGPAHDFRIGVNEIRNDQFVDFLNDALANLDSERGQFLYFDTDSGDVYIHSAQTGTTGTAGEGTLIFRPTSGGQIVYDADAGLYQVVTTPHDYSAHPVTGVSWYGAIKFCNWLTVSTDLAPSERAYTEAASGNLSGWHPVTISEAAWTSRDLNAAERAALLAKLGYRLPMDGGDGAGDPSTYNEWYKAAAWDSAAGASRVYGFGRDSITGADANYRCSGDPFEDAGDCLMGDTTPVGFYDGINTQSDGSPTADTSNSYGLYDMSGNVGEWIQDQSFDPADRRSRGGSFRNAGSFLQAAIGAERAAGTVADSAGFRVVQSVVDALLLTPYESLTTRGPWGGPYDQANAKTYTVENLTNVPVQFAAVCGTDWVTLTVDGVDPVDGIPARSTAAVTVEVAPSCTDGLVAGLNVATVEFRNLSDATQIQRQVRLTVDEPLSVTPSSNYSVTIPFGGAPAPVTYTLTSSSNQSVTWSASAVEVSDPQQEATWITFGGVAGPAGGELGADPTAIEIGFDTTALDTGTHRADIRFVDECTGSTFTRRMTLTIEPTFTVSPGGDVVSTGPQGGPFTPSSHVFTVTNRTDADITDLEVTLTPVEPETTTDWLDVDWAGGVVAVGGDVDITATIVSAALLKPTGQYAITIEFRSPGTGYKVQRDLTLDVSDFPLAPSNGASFTGPQGGPFTPTTFTYTVQNPGVEEMEWIATIEACDPDPCPAWLDVSPSLGLILNPDGTANMELTPAPAAAVLPPGSYVLTLTVQRPNPAGGEPLATTSRSIELDVGQPAYSLSMVEIPVSHVQPSGPAHRYRIADTEVTCARYAQFLNDAQADGGATPRSQNIVIDGATGRVTLPSGEAVLDTQSVQAQSRIRYDDTLEVGTRYGVTSGYESHPATYVSWYGAVKFCNWLTLAQGMDPTQRAYTEGATAAEWGPVAASDGMLGVRGFRLAMDGGAVEADTYNEWYKAAAWDDDAGVNAVYGFGRDELTAADANYDNSSDPFESGTTPVGFYDGSVYNSDGTLDEDRVADEGDFESAADDNAYGLFDMTGNVAEWIHDAGAVAGERAVRGGHHAVASTSPTLLAAHRSSYPPATLTSFIGFRVTQSLPDEALSLVITTPGDFVRVEGEIGGPYQVAGAADGVDTITVAITNPNDFAIDQVDVSVSPAEDRLEVVGVPPSVIPPTVDPEFVPLELGVAATLTSPGVSPAPSGDFVLVRGSDDQAGGPQYDYWISRKEVTNSQFAAFLNSTLDDVRAETPDGRSGHMYFDTATGSVYVNDAAEGAEGTTPPASALLYDASVGRVQYDGDTYTTEGGYSSHPVVGVTWYGALKYCNWLSWSHGVPSSLYAYAEAPGTNLAGWHPVVVDDAEWQANGMTAEARRYLVQDTLGYRLPMDDEAQTESAYNEWHKATGWDRITGQGTEYGFGRDALTSVDANYFGSGDTEADATTPAGFFNGSNTLYAEPATCTSPADEPLKTVDTDAGYGLYDTCGNAAEWMQDFGTGITDRAVRGGSWRDAVDAPSLHADDRSVALSPDAAADDVGFRVVRGTGHVVTVTLYDRLADTSYISHYLLDLREPLRLSSYGDHEESGLYGDDFAGRSATHNLSNHSAADMEWSVSSDAAWLDVAADGTSDTEGSVVGGASADPPVPEATISLTATTNAQANELGPGEHDATVTFTNVSTGNAQTRTFTLSIDQPITVSPDDSTTPEFSGYWGGPFAAQGSLVFSLSRLAALDLDYQISATAAWLDVSPVDPGGALTGTLSDDTPIEFDVDASPSADGLAVGTYDAAVRFRFTDPANGGVTDVVERPVRLRVEAPVTIDWTDGAWTIQDELVPGSLPARDYTLELQTDLGGPAEVTVAVDQDWVDLSHAVIDLLEPNAPRTVTASVNDNALALFDGEYTATITFTDTTTGHEQCRTVVLDVTQQMSVAPYADFQTAVAAGQTASPPLTAYVLTNVLRHADTGIDWQVDIVEPGTAWLTINGGASASGTFYDGDSTAVVVAIDLAATVGMSEQDHTATVRFTDATNGVVVTRTVTMTLVVPSFALARSSVGAAEAQPAGPVYSFEMATFDTTNAEFVAFLNDAMANPANGRGQYMFFDTATGDVYVNTVQAGETGVDPDTRTVKMFSPSVSGQIELVGGQYQVVTTPHDFANHPVTGVTWYGALKYCNWLTIDQGNLPSERCYTEDTHDHLERWHPVTIDHATWGVRDLNDAERLTLVTDYRGYRLPMDDGAGNADPGTDAADAYNEWYKAASWNGMFNTNYGFGRQTVTGADANHLDSGDPFDNGTTPVGYYDGTVQGGTYATNADENVFGIYDMSGDVYQWMQGRFNNSPTSVEFRALRGGSWNTSASSVRTDAREWAPATLAYAEIGLRVVRTIAGGDGDFDGDGDIDAADAAAMAECLTGPYGGVSPACGAFDLQVDQHVDLLDVAAFQNAFNPAP